MPSFRKLLLLMSLLLLHPAFPHHVVFEEIGEMAGALSYVHAIVPVNISGLAHAVNNFKEDVRNLLALYNKNRQPTGLGNDHFFHQRILDLFTLASADADAMLTSIHGLRDTLPLRHIYLTTTMNTGYAADLPFPSSVESLALLWVGSLSDDSII
jgi:hypothetical protein